MKTSYVFSANSKKFSIKIRTYFFWLILAGFFSQNLFAQEPHKENLLSSLKLLKGNCILENSTIFAQDYSLLVLPESLPQKCFLSFEIKIGTKTTSVKPFFISFSQNPEKENTGLKISIWAKLDTIWIEKIFDSQKELDTYKVKLPEKSLNDKISDFEKTKEKNLAQWQEWGLGIMDANPEIRSLDELKKLIEENNSLPFAEEKWTKIAIVKNFNHFTFWIDGRYLATKDVPENIFLVFQLPKETRLKNFKIHTDESLFSDRFLCCDLSGYFNRNIEMKGTFVSEIFHAGKIPFFIGKSDENNILYAGQSRPMETGLGYGGLGDTYSLASGLIKNPSRIVLRIPKGWYKNIYILGFAMKEKNTEPCVSLRFINYTTTDIVTTIPFFDARPKDSSEIPVKEITIGGKKGNLFLIKVPVPACLLQSYLEEDDYKYLEIEITKRLDFTRGYPDPWCFNIVPAGEKSSVYIMGITFERSELEMVLKSKEPGNVFVEPEKIDFDVILRNKSNLPLKLSLEFTLKDYYGEKYIYTQSVNIPEGKQEVIQFQPSVKKYGFYSLELKTQSKDINLIKQTSFIYLPVDNRKATVKNSLFGLWSWGPGKNAGRYSPFAYQYPVDPEIPYKIAKKLGARWILANEPEFAKKYGLAPSWCFIGGTFDPVGQLIKAKVPEEKWEEHLKKNLVEFLKKRTLDFPDQDLFLLFGEPNISAKQTFALPPEYYGGSEYQLNEKEQEKFDKFWKQAVLIGKVFKEIKKEYPEFSHLRLAFGNTSPSFHIEFIKKGYPYFDAFGIDIPFFLRMPERQPRAVELSQLIYLFDARKKYNLESVPIIGTEYMFYPGCPGSLTQKEQADYYVRAHLLSFALGMERCVSTAMIFSAAGPYGRSHYGASGLFEVSPYGGGDGNPRISAAAYATMTMMLDGARFVRWYHTGSFSSFCLLFERDFGKGPVFALWTIHGERTISLHLKNNVQAKITDCMGNPFYIKSQNNILSFNIVSSPLWLEEVSPESIEKIILGEPSYYEKKDETEVKIEDFSKNIWKLKTETDQNFEQNNFDLPRFPGSMDLEMAENEEGKTLKIKLKEQKNVKSLAPLYSFIFPQKPILIKGEPKKIRFRIKGNSAWARVIPQFIDAKGEIWTFIGPKDEWNSDDTYSWSSVNFDGWKNLEIELPYTFPSGVPGPANSFWKCEKGDGVVDFPLALNKIFVEQRTHIWYVNEILPVENPEIILSKILVSYKDPYPDLKATKNW